MTSSLPPSGRHNITNTTDTRTNIRVRCVSFDEDWTLAISCLLLVALLIPYMMNIFEMMIVVNGITVAMNKFHMAKRVLNHWRSGISLKRGISASVPMEITSRVK